MENVINSFLSAEMEYFLEFKLPYHLLSDFLSVKKWRPIDVHRLKGQKYI